MSEPDELRRRTMSSVGWVTIQLWFSRIISLVVFAILTRYIDPSGFGIIALAATFSALLTVFVNAGFAQALIQAKEITERDKSTAFWTSLGVALVLYAALFFTAPLWASLLREPELTLVLQVSGLVLPLSALSITPAALLQREFANKTLAFRATIGVTAGAIVAIGLALVGAGVWALVAQTVVTAAVSTAVLWGSTTWRPSFQFSLASLKKLWAVGASIIGINLLEAIQSNIDKLVIGAAFSTEALGYYFVAQRIGTILSELLTTVMSTVSLPAFARVQDDLPRLNRILRQMTFMSTAAGVLVFGLLAALGPQIVPGVFGEQWAPAVPYLWIFSIGWALATAMSFDRNALIAVGRANAALGISTLQSVVSIALVFALLPLGVIGVVISRLARVTTWPVRIAVLHRIIGMPVGRYLAQIGRALLAGIPVIGAIFLLQGTAWAQIDPGLWLFALPVGILGAVVYAAILWPIAAADSKHAMRLLGKDVRTRLNRRGAKGGENPA